MGKTIKRKIATGMLWLGGLANIVNLGCMDSATTRLEKYKITAGNNIGKVKLCGDGYIDRYIGEDYLFYTESNQKNQAFRDEMCKQGIINFGETPTENFREQGKKIYLKIQSPMINLLYDGKILFFSKSGYPERFAVELSTLTAYEHIEGNKWKDSPLITKWARESRSVYRTIDQMKAQQNLQIARKTNRETTQQGGTEKWLSDVYKGAFIGMLGDVGTYEYIKSDVKNSN